MLPSHQYALADGRRFPVLDGLRAVAVGLVLLHHYWRPGLTHTPLDAVAAGGAFGVEVFFVLSGFLITHLLLREEAAAGAISGNSASR